MREDYRKIRGRYDDVLCGVLDVDMFRDVQALLRYIEVLHEQLAHYRACAELALVGASEPCRGELVH